MHEYSIVRELLDRVEEEARDREATAVCTVRVRVGELSGVEIELLESAFELARTGTLCQAADLHVVPVEVRWICSSCDEEIGGDGVLRCDRCGGPARLAAGGEILLERIEMEAPDV